MKKLLTITAAGLLFAVAGAATAGEGLKASAYGGCAYGAALETVSTVPVITPVPVKTASQTTTATKSGG